MSWKVKAFTISVCNKNKFYFTISEPNNYISKGHTEKIIILSLEKMFYKLRSMSHWSSSLTCYCATTFFYSNQNRNFHFYTVSFKHKSVCTTTSIVENKIAYKDSLIECRLVNLVDKRRLCTQILIGLLYTTMFRIGHKRWQYFLWTKFVDSK